MASEIKELEWVRDGISGPEAEMVQNFLYISVASRPVAASLISV